MQPLWVCLQRWRMWSSLEQCTFFQKCYQISQWSTSSIACPNQLAGNLKSAATNGPGKASLTRKTLSCWQSFFQWNMERVCTQKLPNTPQASIQIAAPMIIKLQDHFNTSQNIAEMRKIMPPGYFAPKKEVSWTCFSFYKKIIIMFWSVFTPGQNMFSPVMNRTCFSVKMFSGQCKIHSFSLPSRL